MKTCSCSFGPIFTTYCVSLFLFFVCLKAPLVRAQIKFADLQAGYEENRANLAEQGLRFRYVLEQTDFAEALEAWNARDLKSYRAMLASDEYSTEESTQIQNLVDQLEARKYVESESEKYFDVFMDSKGLVVRVFPGDENAKVRDVEFDEFAPAFDDRFGDLEVDSFFWSKEKNFTSVASAKQKVKYFGIVQNGFAEVETAHFNAPGTLNEFNIYSFVPNVPVDISGHDAVDGTFVSVGSFVYSWDPPIGKVTEAKMLGNSLCELKIKTNWKKLQAYEGVSHAIELVAKIDMSRGFLPVSIKIGNRYLTADEGEYSSEDLGVWKEIQCKIDELAGGFYISEATLRENGTVLDYPTTKSFSKSIDNRLLYGYRQGRKGNFGKEVKIRSAKLTVLDMQKWKSADPAVFSPEAPNEASFSNTITGETRMGKGHFEKLKLDLDAGEKPLRDDFSTEGPAIGNERSSLQVLFWVVVLAVGIGMVWLSKKWKYSK